MNDSSEDIKSLVSSILENEELLFSILDFCDERSRVNSIFLSTQQHSLLTSESSFQWRLKCLHREWGVYHPLCLPNPSSTWRDIFLKNLKLKHLWQRTTTDTGVENRLNTEEENSPFHIQVSARFKPKNKDDAGDINTGKKIALPLYQRLALIKMNRNLSSKKEAFQVLYEQGGWFGEENKEISKEDSVGDETRDDQVGEKGKNISTEDEEKKALPSLRGGVHMIDTTNNYAILVDATKGLRKFDFDNVIDEFSEQESVYKGTTMALTSEFINGFNVSCIVYGQTGSGKTHTMYGDNNFEHPRNNKIPPSWGIVPRSCHEIFAAIEFRKKNLNLDIDVEIAVSYIEVFGDSVTDLLRGGKSCGQSKVSAQRYVLDGASEVVTTSMSNTLSLLEEGEKQKRKAATAMNERSSRAHSIFIIRMTQTCVNTDVSSTSRLFLADLGGSEQLKKSQPFKSGNKEQSDFERKQRAREAVNINLGLLALKQCVEALRKKASFVPYSDSKLTMMLSSGLGGDSKTAVIVCGAQEPRHGAETIAAMKFGQTCRGISNTVKTTNHMLQELLETINDRISECEENIKKYEKWETLDVEHVCGNGEIEMRKKTVLVGAEKYREQLSALLQSKAELTGDTSEILYAGSNNEVEGFGNAHVYGLGKKVVKQQNEKDGCTQS